MAIIALVRSADAKQRSPEPSTDTTSCTSATRADASDETIRTSVGALADTVDGVCCQVPPITINMPMRVGEVR